MALLKSWVLKMRYRPFAKAYFGQLRRDLARFMKKDANERDENPLTWWILAPLHQRAWKVANKSRRVSNPYAADALQHLAITALALTFGFNADEFAQYLSLNSRYASSTMPLSREERDQVVEGVRHTVAIPEKWEGALEAAQAFFMKTLAASA